MSKTQAIQREGYSLTLRGKNVEITDAIRQYVEKKAEKIERYTHDILHLIVTVEVQKMSHTIVIDMHFSHFKVVIHASTEDMYSAIDKGFDKLIKKLRQWKGRIQEHHAKGASIKEVEVEILEGKEEDLDQEIIDENNDSLLLPYTIPKVVRRKKRPLKILTLDEAVMKMELSNDNFLVYREEAENLLKVLYRRRDGSYGVMAVE